MTYLVVPDVYATSWKRLLLANTEILQKTHEKNVNLRV